MLKNERWCIEPHQARDVAPKVNYEFHLQFFEGTSCALSEIKENRESWWKNSVSFGYR
jgi:hypothetical protein